MQPAYEELCRAWDPWQFIPPRYNLGTALTRGPADRPAILWENACCLSTCLTYRQLDVLTNRLACSLARLGVRPGDRVLLRLPNIPECYVAFLAAAKLGAVFIPTSIQFKEAEIRYRLRDSEAVVAITTPRLLPAIERSRGDCPALRHVIVVPDDAGQALPGDTLSYLQLIADGSESFAAAPTRSDDVAFIAYTSGTTGDPKGVVHLHRYPLGYEALIRHWHDYQPHDVVACPSELGWLLPVACTFLYALSRGLTVFLYDAQGPPLDAGRWYSLISKYRVTNLTASPTIYRVLMADAEVAQRYDLSNWRHAVSAGEPLPAHTFNTLREQLGITVLDGLGMSECMVYAFNSVGTPVKAGSCGRPGPGCVIDVLDEDLQPVAHGQPGVLCVRRGSHPGMMKEYWRKPEQTAEIFRGDWYWSGDVVVRDDDGYLWFKGRNDDVMKACGYRISPFEVESCLMCHPAVLEAAAVEWPDELRGGIVKAFVVLRPGFDPTVTLRHEIQHFAKERMANYKYPRKLEFLAALPKTPSGKIKRRDLRALHSP